ncbi:MAG: ArnT family glycosyltransferase [Gammaproteobacteria bacterium]
MNLKIEEQSSSSAKAEDSFNKRYFPHYFILFFIAAFLIKCLLASIVPITGDEAEYIYWGQHLAWGYYDHPPMIAWWLAPFVKISVANLWVRMPQILVTSIISILLYYVCRYIETQNPALRSTGNPVSRDRENSTSHGLSAGPIPQKISKRAFWIALLFLISPVNLLDIFIVTDTPLMLFTFLAVTLLYFAEKRNDIILHIIAGICFGAAYLSKFLMFPVMLGVLAYFLFVPNVKNRFKKLLCLALGGLPFLLQNIVWNYNNSWVNYAFNITLRNEDDSFQFSTAFEYFVTLLYLFNPAIIYYFIKHIKGILSQSKLNFLYLHSRKGDNPESPTSAISPAFAIFFWVFITPLLFYFVTSFYHRIGLHWLFCFYTFAFILLLKVLTPSEIKKCIGFTLVYSLVHVIAVCAIAAMPISVWQNHTSFNKLIFLLKYHDLENIAAPYVKKGYVVMTPNYSHSYSIAYRPRWEVADWGVNSVHARQDDFSSDFRQFDHKNVVIIDFHFIEPTKYAPYFDSISLEEKNLNGVPYQLVLGKNFHYEDYRENVLQKINAEYYQLPQWLPYAHNYYAQKYDL